MLFPGFLCVSEGVRGTLVTLWTLANLRVCTAYCSCVFLFMR